MTRNWVSIFFFLPNRRPNKSSQLDRFALPIWAIVPLSYVVQQSTYFLYAWFG